MIYDAYLYKNLLSIYINNRGLSFTLTKIDQNKDKILKEFLVSFYNTIEFFFDVYYPISCSFLQQAYLISQKFIQYKYDDVLKSIINKIKSK